MIIGNIYKIADDNVLSPEQKDVIYGYKWYFLGPDDISDSITLRFCRESIVVIVDKNKYHMKAVVLNAKDITKREKNHMIRTKVNEDLIVVRIDHMSYVYKNFDILFKEKSL